MKVIPNRNKIPLTSPRYHVHYTYTRNNNVYPFTMIHYINGKPHKNITLQKPKRHAVAHYRHTKRMNTLREGVYTVGALLATIALIIGAMIIL